VLITEYDRISLILEAILRLHLTCYPRQAMKYSIRLSIILICTTGWGCTSKPPDPRYPKGVALVVERQVRKVPTNECELSIGLLNNTQATLNRRTVKYRVFAEDFKASIVESNYQVASPILPGQVGDKKVFKVKTDCSNGLGAQFLELEASGLFGMTYKPEKYPEIPVDVCEDAQNTLYLFRDCKRSILD
jgi:hypothetical protein